MENENVDTINNMSSVQFNDYIRRLRQQRREAQRVQKN